MSLCHRSGPGVLAIPTATIPCDSLGIPSYFPVDSLESLLFPVDSWSTTGIPQGFLEERVGECKDLKKLGIGRRIATKRNEIKDKAREPVQMEYHSKGETIIGAEEDQEEMEIAEEEETLEDPKGEEVEENPSELSQEKIQKKQKLTMERKT
ncbi:hypothetical protein M378DRAFT_9639 [Amanita muscaria Koide BX008]|uniref:Uncharacterized protein n=1 Tax=Amanita muscaria (strain Koide BX008) TaxID=946122 RepID=A0A0C2XF12_AMAMK|nr:hypothetical protein M378DRAFT_9639 [Amanita muscaria Koide BX008]